MKMFTVVFLVLATSACAVPRVQVDLQDPTNPDNYQNDLLECQGLAYRGVSDAEQLSSDVATGAAMNTAGSLITGSSLVEGLGAGLIGSMVNAPREAEIKRERLITHCLWGRGYTVIGHYAVYATPGGRCIHIDRLFNGGKLQACHDMERQRQVEWSEKWGKAPPVFDDDDHFAY